MSEIGTGVAGLFVHGPATALDELGQTKIHHLDLLVRRVRIDNHQIRWLQIAMNNPLGMSGLQRFAQLAKQAAGSRGIEALVA